MRIGLITTLNTNIGDDFIRRGIMKIVTKNMGHVEFIAINKHDPMTMYGRWNPARLPRFLPKGRRTVETWVSKAVSRISHNVFETCDALIQCGAPVLWPGCHSAGWIGPIWYDTVRQLHQEIPVLNLAAGSAYPWEEKPEAVEDPKDRAFLKDISDFCRITTVRDELAFRLMKSVGAQPQLLACTAFLAPDTTRSSGDGPIIVNYMRGGGHFAFGQSISPTRWEATTREVVRHIGKTNSMLFLCHNNQELEAVEDVAPGAPRILPRTPSEYFEAVRGAKAGLVNRLHAAVTLAGLGIPCIAVGTDTRLLMIRELGLPFLYVNETTAAGLTDTLEELLARRDDETDRLVSLKASTIREYERCILPTLGWTNAA